MLVVTLDVEMVEWWNGNWREVRKSSEVAEKKCANDLG